MKNIALVAALAIASTLGSVRIAAACGVAATVQSQPRTAVGVYPRIERERDRTVLTLAYPQFDGRGPQVYVDSFEVVRDRKLLRLERRLAHTRGMNLDVAIARVDATHWRVTGWSVRA